RRRSRRARGRDRRRLSAVGGSTRAGGHRRARYRGQAPPRPRPLTMATFAELGLPEHLLRTIAELGFEEPTPIQEQAIPELLAGKDVIGQAQTGTGKTAAFGLPLMTYL